MVTVQSGVLGFHFTQRRASNPWGLGLNPAHWHQVWPSECVQRQWPREDPVSEGPCSVTRLLEKSVKAVIKCTEGRHVRRKWF